MEGEERLASLFPQQIWFIQMVYVSVLTLQALVSRFQILHNKVPFFIDAHIYQKKKKILKCKPELHRIDWGQVGLQVFGDGP